MLKLILSFLIICVFTSANDDLDQFLQSNKIFTSKIYKQVSKQNRNRNFLICPFSAETALSLAQHGAYGKTRKEIRNALSLPDNSEIIKSTFKNFLDSLKSNDDYTLHSANRIFIKDNLPIKEEFSTTAERIYQSSVVNIDFTKTQDAAEFINAWVSSQTKDKIQNLINPDSLSKETVAVIVNAIYFQAIWRKNFKKTLTRPRDFYKNGKELIQVESMEKADFYRFYENEDAKFLQMPFKSRNASLIVILPNQIDGLKNLENNVDKIFNENEFKWEFVYVVLPKFKIETTVDMKKVLRNLGMKRAFTRADFSGMAGKKGEIHISDVVQKSFISVNENGVEAAATTAITYHPKSLIEVNEDKKAFIANHPFIFYIRVNGIIIFTGRVVSP